MEETSGYMKADKELIEKINENMPDEDMMCDLADLYKIFGDSTRIKILCVLSESDMCVYDIAAILNMTASAISHQLSILKQSRLVRYKREGKTVTYSLADDHVKIIIAQGMDHISE